MLGEALRVLLEWGRGRQAVATAAVLFSLLCHAASLVFGTGTLPEGGFAQEVTFFIVLSAAGSVAVFSVDDYRVFLPIHLVRALSAVIAIRILRDATPGSELLLMVPLAGETAIYMGLTPGLIANAVLIGLSAAALRTGRQVFALRADLGRIASFFLVSSSTAGLAALLVQYREKAVRDEGRLTELGHALIRLSDANRAFQAYADDAESRSVARERSRVTRELHDSVGYGLTNVAMSINAAKVLIRRDPDRAVLMLGSAREQLEESLKETRRTLRELREIKEAAPLGLQALHHLARVFELSTGVKVSLNYGNIPQTYGKQIDDAIYRLVQEGLTNAFRHGKATSVRVSFWQAESEIRIGVWNNGLGAGAITAGIGLSGMGERFAELGGRVTPRDVADGFELSASIPYRDYMRHGESTHGHR